MNRSIKEMLAPYVLVTSQDRKNAMKEVMQEIVLCGLSRAGFFDRGAFYGGTALRIFHGLDRFSEDMDFSLMVPDATFSLADYFDVLQTEIRSYGLNMEIALKEKTNESQIQSAFLKGDTLEHYLLFYPDNSDGISASEKVKIKLEIDVDPAPCAGFERRYRLLPVPHEVCLYDKPSLFAGKVHAVLCRTWKNRVKGRDLYDYVFYLSHGVPVNLAHLRAKLVATGFIAEAEAERMGLGDIKHMLCERFGRIDFAAAKEDVLPFLDDASKISLWSEAFFCSITEGLVCE